MNSKARGNVALGRAVSYFTRMGFFVFVPFGDHSGSIDIVVSPDGNRLYRVQCKHSTQVHTEILKRTGKKVYRLSLLNYTGDNEKGAVSRTLVYSEDSFDILFISTPEEDRLIDWRALCRSTNPFRTTGGTPKHLVVGKRLLPFSWTPDGDKAVTPA